MKIKMYKGPWYQDSCKIRNNPKGLRGPWYRERNDYIRFEWDHGYIDMRMSHYEKLSKKKRDLIMSAETRR